MTDRLTALDSSFLHLERGPVHMHVGSCMTFTGPCPDHDDLVRAVEARLHLVPRYRQRLASVPFGQGRPVWVDDPHFNPYYHVRHTALPAPGGADELRRLCGRIFSQRLDRSKPLWELWLVQGLAPARAGGEERFAIVAKTHHALVDGISGVDITTVLFDAKPEPVPTGTPEEPWVPRPVPTGTQLLADALLERTTVPAEMVRGVRAALRTPLRAVKGVAGAAGSVGALAAAGVTSGAPDTPYNVPIGPHRRFAWAENELDRIKGIKNALGGSVNDVVLAAVAGGLGRHLRRRGHPTRGLTLRAMVPVSVRADVERGALGNRVSAVYAPLAVGVTDPIERLTVTREAMAGLKESGQAVGAEILTRLGDFAPPTILSQATRLAVRQRFFNVVVTNVPGPQIPLYILGRQMDRLYPLVPLAPNQALGIAILSYNGHLDFGLHGDYDAMADIDDLALDLGAAVDELAEAAGLEPSPRPRRGRRAAAGTR